jgi:hypothetical protein
LPRTFDSSYRHGDTSRNPEAKAQRRFAGSLQLAQGLLYSQPDAWGLSAYQIVIGSPGHSGALAGSSASAGVQWTARAASAASTRMPRNPVVFIFRSFPMVTAGCDGEHPVRLSTLALPKLECPATDVFDVAWRDRSLALA